MALFSQHPLKLPTWIAAQRKAFGTKPEVHTAGTAHLRTKLGRRLEMPWIDYAWEGVASLATSAWGARKLAAALGFSPVVLCGVPLDVGDYANGRAAKHFRQRGKVVHYRQKLQADREWHAGAVSMSGWTREFLGAPA